MGSRPLWKIGLVCLVATLLAASFWVFRPKQLALGILVPSEVLQEATKGHEYPDLTGAAGEFTGPTVLWIGEDRIELSDALVTYFMNAGYPTSYFALERTGHLSREDFIARWAAHLAIARALPEWRQSASVVADPADAAAARALLDEMAPGKRYAAAKKLGLFSGRFRQEVQGRPFYTELSVNVTYDQNRPDTPFRFAFEQGVHAQSRVCLPRQIGDVIKAKRGLGPERAETDPALVEVFEGWDGRDETLRTFIDTYVFEKCSLNASDWSEL